MTVRRSRRTSDGMSDRTVEGIGLYPEDRAYIDRIRRAHGLTSLASVVRHALKATHDALPPPSSPVRPATALDGAERLRAAMGDHGAREVERWIDCSHGTLRNVLVGATPLASAAGGAVLAWVEAQERMAAK